MKIALASDLHTSLYQDFVMPLPADVDLLILAGDIGEGLEGIEWTKAQGYHCPVLYTPGNHEFYLTEYHTHQRAMKAAVVDTNITLLDNSVFELGGYRFVGATLWTDYMINENNGTPQDLAMFHASQNLNDHFKIRWGSFGNLFDPAHALALHSISKDFIKTELTSHDPRKTVVVTHHSPTTKMIAPQFKNDKLNGCFVSDMHDFIMDNNPILWACGHTHWDCDEMIGDTRVISNQRGYRNERARNGQGPFEIKVIELPLIPD